jgi:hypothetical protein
MAVVPTPIPCVHVASGNAVRADVRRATPSRVLVVGTRVSTSSQGPHKAPHIEYVQDVLSPWCSALFLVAVPLCTHIKLCNG